MALLLPQPTDQMNSPAHDYLHRVIAIDSTSPEQSFKVIDNLGNIEASGYVSGKDGINMSFRTSSTATSGFYLEDSDVTPKIPFTYGKRRDTLKCRIYAENAPSGQDCVFALVNESSGVTSPYLTLSSGLNSVQINDVSFDVWQNNGLSCYVISGDTDDLYAAANVTIDIELL